MKLLKNALLIFLIISQSLSIILILLMRKRSEPTSSVEIVRENSDGTKWKRTYYHKLKAIKNEGIYTKDSIEHGFNRSYSDDGSIKWEASYKDGKIEGIVREYYNNGSDNNFLHREGRMYNGKKVGLWKHFSENGNPHLIMIYDSLGHLEYSIHFDDRGRVQEEKEY